MPSCRSWVTARCRRSGPGGQGEVHASSHSELLRFVVGDHREGPGGHPVKSRHPGGDSEHGLLANAGHKEDVDVSVLFTVVVLLDVALFVQVGEEVLDVVDPWEGVLILCDS